MTFTLPPWLGAWLNAASSSRTDANTALRNELDQVKRAGQEREDRLQREIEDLKEQLREKDRMIKKFEMFIDICNERVMVQREKLASDGDDPVNGLVPPHPLA